MPNGVHSGPDNSASRFRDVLVVLIGAMATIAPVSLATNASAAPDPQVEYVYDVVVRRHYGFPNGDAIAYGHGICDRVGRGESYAQVMSEVKNEVTPSDEFAANYLISYAVNFLCPDLIWQLRNSAGGYRPAEPPPPFTTFN